MKEYLQKTRNALHLLKNHLTSHDDYQTTSVSDPDKQKNYDTISAFIVDWQEPIPIKDVEKNN